MRKNHVQPLVIAISPHSDDIAWSVSNLMYLLKMHHYSLILITVFGKSLFTKTRIFKHYPIPTKLRKNEDIQYCNMIDAKLIWMGLVDNGNPESTTIRKNLYFDEDLLEKALMILAPLAIGDHPDHLSCYYELQKYSNKLIWYEDLPYAASIGNISAYNFAIKRLGENAINLKIPIENINQRIKYIQTYSSQIDKGLIEIILNYLYEIGNGYASERIWFKNPNLGSYIHRIFREKNV